MANLFIYIGVGIMLFGTIFGMYVAIRGYREIDWSSVKRRPMFGNLSQHKMTPAMRKLTWMWCAIMFFSFIIVGVGLSIGLA